MVAVLVFAAPFSGSDYAVGQSTRSIPNSAKRNPNARTTVAPRTCMEVAKKFAADVEQGNVPAISGLIDWDEIFRRGTVGIEASAKFRQSFAEGYRESSSSSFGPQMIASIKGGGSYRVVRGHMVKGQARILIRLDSPTHGINYHDMSFYRDQNDQVRIADLYVYTAGEQMSEILRRGFLPAPEYEQWKTSLQEKSKSQ